MSSSPSSSPESSPPPSVDSDGSAPDTPDSDASATDTSTTDDPTPSRSSSPDRSSAPDNPVGDKPTDAKQTGREQPSDETADDVRGHRDDPHAKDTDTDDAMKQETTADAPTAADQNRDRDTSQSTDQTSAPASRAATTAPEVDHEATETPQLGEAPPRSTCANCESPLVGPYCAQCGQRAADRIVPMTEMTREWIEDLFEFDLRIFRTLPTFFFKPGRLTKEYVQGRRVRYVRPLRLYLVASFILFTLLAFTDLATVNTESTVSGSPTARAFSEETDTTTSESASMTDAAGSNAAAVPVQAGSTQETASQEPGASPAAPSGPSGQSSAATLDTAAVQQLQQLRNLDVLSDADRAEIDSITRAAFQQAQVSREEIDQAVSKANQAAADGGQASDRSAIAQKVTQDMNLTVSLFDDPQRNDEAEAFIKKRLGQTIENPNAFVRAMVDRAPYVMFLLLPIFALLMKLLYIRRAKLYVQHLIFALHIHALAFFVFAASTGLLITESSTLHTLGGWMTLLPFLYLYVAMHHVYEQGWGKTLFKAFLLLTIYNTVLIVGLVGLAIASFLLM